VVTVVVQLEGVPADFGDRTWRPCCSEAASAMRGKAQVQTPRGGAWHPQLVAESNPLASMPDVIGLGSVHGA
jgi:hypothetical protein